MNDVPRDLREKFGELIPVRELARMLGYSSVSALNKSADRGHLPFRLVQLPGRRGRFAFSRDVAAWLESIRGEADSLAIPGDTPTDEETAM